MSPIPSPSAKWARCGEPTTSLPGWMLYVPAVPLFFANRARINSLALAARLPTIHLVREYVEAGGLMSYGPNWPDMWRQAADLVDKILHGTKPADIPVQQPTRFDLVLNLKTAKALGLT